MYSMALRSQDDGFGIATSWILERDLDLTDPGLRRSIASDHGPTTVSSSNSLLNQLAVVGVGRPQASRERLNGARSSRLARSGRSIPDRGNCG